MIGERLKAERERLGMTQEAFAGLAGAKRRTLVDWEKGVSSPTTAQLSALAAVGVDVLYVVTGELPFAASAARQALLGGGLATSSPKVADVGNLTPDAKEAELLRDYRRCAAEDQATVRQIAARLAGSKRAG